MKDKIISHWTIVVGIALMILIGSLPMVLRDLTQNKNNTTTNPEKTLVMWGLFDERDVYQGMIEQYESQTGIKVKYYKISNSLSDYEKLLLNEIAEGKGPDIFMIKNTWLPRHQGKLTPLPENLHISPEIYNQKFLSVVSKDLVADEKIYGIPLYVDSLALYYNEEIYQTGVPSRTKPSETWDGIKEDSQKITRADNSVERFSVAGISLGRLNNISRGFDILLLQMLQAGISLHDASNTSANFANTKTANGENLAQNIWQFFVSFSDPNYENYCWNESITRNNSAQEVDAFARGKVAMIFGYSYLYEDIKNQIKEVNKRGETGISFADVKIALMPQADENTQITLANYFPYAVSRNSQNAEEAWKFLLYLTEEGNLREYNRQTNRPTSVRSLVEEQSLDKTYGVFAKQSEYAQSVTMWDENEYAKIFAEAIGKITSGRATLSNALQEAQDNINNFLTENRILKNSTNAS